MTSTTKSFHLSDSPHRIQGRLLVFAGVFLGLYALGLTLAPAARTGTWEGDYRWNHWLGYLAWLILILIVNRQIKRILPNQDPFLLPVAALLSGWGLMTIWRLFPDFGLRQTMWFVISMVLFAAGLRLPQDLLFLRRYKYVLLTGGLVLTALTLLFGTNPGGNFGPNLWLGCCGVYFQPSEPLKLLLIIYLSAYLADKQPWTLISSSSFRSDDSDRGEGDRGKTESLSAVLPLLVPILIMTGLILLLLLVQRDLGTATIFLFLFAVIVYLATGRRLVLILSGVLLFLAGISSYFLFDVVRLRIDAWLNPWLDPSGRSYQIVQSLLAIAHGGVGGRGPGMGSPTLVPISHSDFIFTAIVEESGLVGGIALVVLLMVLTASGLRIAQRAPDNFRRYLAAGLTVYLIGQSLLIIGGNIRLLPLTGVTLPFVSYGGSSLLTAFASLLLLILISQSANANPLPAINTPIYTRLGAFLLVGLSVAALIIGWWTYVRGPGLLGRTDNARRGIAERFVKRGEIFDRDNIPLVTTTGSTGEYSRHYNLPNLGSTVGYSHPVYGQSGLEASLDPYLRGLEGNARLEIWWNHLLYGRPPPGLDVRLSLDMDLHQVADELLGDRAGALILLNAENGEILSLASHPTFDPNQLEENWLELVNDDKTPLLNRAIQGQYPPGTALGPFLMAALTAEGGFAQFPETDFSEELFASSPCAITPGVTSWAGVISAGCELPQVILSEELGQDAIQKLYEDLGFFIDPGLGPLKQEDTIPPLILSPQEIISGQSEFRLSPLQMALAAATISSGGSKPIPILASALNRPDTGWTVFLPSGEPHQVFSKPNADGVAGLLSQNSLPIWDSVATTVNEPDQVITWYLGGTLPTWTGAPISLVIILEEDSPQEALAIGQAMMEAALQVE
jgi:cell division protein FtsW (lipid II flippase)